MSDNKTKKAPQDAQRINLHEAYEIEYWTERFNVGVDRLKLAVARVGPMVKDVEAELKKH